MALNMDAIKSAGSNLASAVSGKSASNAQSQVRNASANYNSMVRNANASSANANYDPYGYGGWDTAYGYGYGYGGGGGGGGASSGPSQGMKDAADNLSAITGYNANTITGKADNGDKAFDVSDQQNKNLQMFQLANAEKTAGNDWYTQQQKLQGVLSQQRDVMGNAFNGSGMLDLAEDMARADDMSDVQVLNQLRENMDSIDSDYYQALMATNNSRNELYLDTEADLRQLYADYVSQMNNIHPDLVNGEEDDFPELIDTKNHDLKGVDWLDTDYFSKHMREAITPEYRGQIRPDQAALTAYKQALVPRKSNYSSSSNQNYYQRVFGGYNRRTQ